MNIDWDLSLSNITHIHKLNTRSTIFPHINKVLIKIGVYKCPKCNGFIYTNKSLSHDLEHEVFESVSFLVALSDGLKWGKEWFDGWMWNHHSSVTTHKCGNTVIKVRSG